MSYIMKIYIFLISLFLTVSCTIDPPFNFVKTGVPTKDAILFLEQLQNTKQSKELFSDHIKQLNANAAVGFDWTQYWNEIDQKTLYKKLDKTQLESMLQLSRLSCDTSAWQAFASLLLKLAEMGTDYLYFKHYLTGSKKTCSTFLLNKTLKEIVTFLDKKRNETEAQLFSEEKVSFQWKQKINSIADKKNNLKEKYPYTYELYGVVVDEWNVKTQGRAWGDILSVVNREFWSDIRWMFYHVGSFESIRTALEMEMDIYHSISDLDQDILLIFHDREIKNIMDLVGYEEYFKQQGLVEWEQLWRKLIEEYPDKPNNSNNTLLLSFYKYSCGKEELVAYMDLIRSWDLVDQYRTIVERECEQIIRITKQITQYIDTAGLPADGAFPLSMEDMREMLEGTEYNRSIDDLVRLLNFYDRFKIDYSIPDWEILLNEQFSIEHWLYFMNILRGNYDKSIIRRVMDMHQYVYQGRIPFLSFDVFNILINEDISLSSLVTEYSYSESQLMNPDFINQFWSIVQEDASKVLNSRDQWINLFEYGSHFCNQVYLNKMVDFFNYNKQEQLLLNNFDFDSCPNYFMDIPFKESFINSAVTKIRQDTNQDPELYWDLVRSFSLYTSNNSAEEMQNTAVLKMNEVEWKKVFDITILTLREPIYKNNSAFLKRAMDLVGKVYKRAVDSAICQQLLGVSDSHKIITAYDPELVIHLFNQLNWNSSDCSTLESDRLNLLMFIISDYLFSAVEEHVDTVDYVLGVWSQAVRVINIMENIHDSETPFSNVLGTWWISDPDVVNGEMTHRAFRSFFSHLILSYLIRKASLVSAVDILDTRIWQNSTANEYHKWYEELLKDSIEEYPSQIEELDQLRADLTLG